MHVPRVRQIVEYGVVLSRLAEYLIDAQGRKLWRSDVDNIRVLYSLFLASHDVLHEVHCHGLVGRHVLVAVHGQQLQELSEILEELPYIIDLFLRSVMGG